MRLPSHSPGFRVPAQIPHTDRLDPRHGTKQICLPRCRQQARLLGTRPPFIPNPPPPRLPRFLESLILNQHSFLLHVALTLTTMHDAYLSLGNPSTNNNLIAFHWSQGASLLNARLTNGIDPSERDALWACSTLLGALSFCSTPARCPQESWPLKPDPSGSDLDWLKMTEGKKAIWKLSDPLREDSIFYPHMADFIPGFAALAPSAQSLDTLPRELVELCGINRASPNSDNNPNAPLLNLLTHFLPLPCNATTLGRFMSFFGCMSPSYRLLLAHKDPGALLLLAYWYAKLLDYRQWWLLPRARVECAAICIYLELCHGHEGNIIRLVEFPKTACGLVDGEEALSEKGGILL